MEEMNIITSFGLYIVTIGYLCWVLILYDFEKGYMYNRWGGKNGRKN